MSLTGAVVAALGLAHCADDTPRDDVCPVTSPILVPEDFEGSLLRCSVVPELCDLEVASEVRDANLSRAIDLVFVSDGYTADALDLYRGRVEELVAALDADTEGIVARAPELFNFHRVDLASSSSHPEDRPLASCAERRDGSWFALGDTERSARAAANAPDMDVIVVVVNGTKGTRNGVSGGLGGTELIFLTSDSDDRVLTHELGHILVGLGDEYVDFDQRSPQADRWVAWTAEPLEPNLSLSSEGRWQGLVEGAYEGGGRYATGVFRPTASCRMRRHQHGTFCPVCSAAIDEVLRGRAGLSTRPPDCGVALGGTDPLGLREVVAFARDSDGTRSLTLSADGAPVFDVPSTRQFRSLRLDDPLSFDVATQVPGDVTTLTVSCADARGDTAEATLDNVNGRWTAR